MYLTNKLNNRNQHYLQSCGWFGVSYIYIHWMLVSWLWLSLRSWQADINLAAIFAHSDFSPRMKASFSVGVQLVNWGNILFILG